MPSIFAIHSYLSGLLKIPGWNFFKEDFKPYSHYHFN